MNFRHFKTLKQVRAYMTDHPHDRLVYRRYKNRAKPYMVGTQLSFLHFA